MNHMLTCIYTNIYKGPNVYIYILRDIVNHKYRPKHAAT